MTVAENLKMGCYTLPGAGARRGDRARQRRRSPCCARNGAPRPATCRAASSRSWKWPWCCWSSPACCCSTSPRSACRPGCRATSSRRCSGSRRPASRCWSSSRTCAARCSISDRALVMEQGRLFMEGPADGGAHRSAHPPGLSRRQHPADGSVGAHGKGQGQGKTGGRYRRHLHRPLPRGERQAHQRQGADHAARAGGRRAGRHGGDPEAGRRRSRPTSA